MNQVSQTLELLEKDFSNQQLELPSSLVVVGDFEELREKLANILSKLLDNDFGRLCNLMYRIDVDEEAFRAALAFEQPNDIAVQLAELVIQREIKKTMLRQKFSKTH